MPSPVGKDTVGKRSAEIRMESTVSVQFVSLNAAVLCVDQQGCVAVGVSTSGPAFKHPGRVGDVPLIGCGFYALDEVKDNKYTQSHKASLLSI